MNMSLVWNISDCMNALMAIPNLVSLLLLSGVLVAETKYYLWEDRLEEEGEPIEEGEMEGSPVFIQKNNDDLKK